MRCHALARYLAGRSEEAKSALDRVLALRPGFSLAYVDATYPFKDPAHRALFLEGLKRAGWGG